jgi:hypothetical protein
VFDQMARHGGRNRHEDRESKPTADLAGGGQLGRSTIKGAARREPKWSQATAAQRPQRITEQL